MLDTTGLSHEHETLLLVTELLNEFNVDKLVVFLSLNLVKVIAKILDAEEGCLVV